MKALVYNGPGEKAWKDVPDPSIMDPTDAVMQVDTTTICGTDLHILGGDVPAVTQGRILGHEAVGTITEVGSAVTEVKPGDRVLASCVSACGRCRYCREQRYGQCLNGGGWILGHLIDGTQAEKVRLPYADLSTYKLPSHISNEAAMLLSDILPTSYEVGVLNGMVGPGDTVVIVGGGPIGLSAVIGARLFSPAHIVMVDLADARLDAAKKFGADVVCKPDQARRVVDELTGGLGADVAMEAVGIPATFEQCAQLIRPGGRVANMGVHGKPVDLHLEDLWIKDITITTGLVDTCTIPTLLRMVETGQLQVAERMITHRFPLGNIMEAYDVFSRPNETGALKVALNRE